MTGARFLSATMGVALLAACSHTAGDDGSIDNTQSVESAAADLAAMMAQNFAASEPSDSGVIYSDYRPRMAPLGKGEWVYLHRNRGDAPYRQRVLQLIEQEDGSVRQVAYALSDPEALAEAPWKPELVAGITRDQLQRDFTEDCDQIWRLTEYGWYGVVDPAKCLIMSQRRGKQIRIGAEARLTASSLQEAERGFDMDGTQIWGTPEGEWAQEMRVGE